MGDAGIFDKAGECTYIGSTAKIEASDIDTCEFDTSSDSPSCAESHNRASEKVGDGTHCERINAGSSKDSGGETVRQQQHYEMQIK